MAGAYPGFCSMKQLRVLLLPRDGMLVHCRATPSSTCMSPVPMDFIHLGGERQCGVKYLV